MIAKAIAPDDSGDLLKKWESSNWSRRVLNRFLGKQSQIEEAPLLDGDEQFSDENIDVDSDVHSRVANLLL